MSSLIFIASSEAGEREKEREDMVIGGLGKVDSIPSAKHSQWIFNHV